MSSYLAHSISSLSFSRADVTQQYVLIEGIDLSNTAIKVKEASLS